MAPGVSRRILNDQHLVIGWGHGVRTEGHAPGEVAPLEVDGVRNVDGVISHQGDERALGVEDCAHELHDVLCKIRHVFISPQQKCVSISYMLDHALICQ